ncbi:hypothetical protein SLG_28480 [Sphingobium sp. SYK-6]|uniref:hypothetical protein n=1 Tax=Sphingobium sp. (strain NBRC 103272 / SYK-6) TaxID=627192 RepID=UPI0002277158|nr:hypothetical protein [Sphingobium sp. SYK-6]BAK67523.1 hypothetical protein SLG_28480 [Sphingobium sp. SYK-6]
MSGGIAHRRAFVPALATLALLAACSVVESGSDNQTDPSAVPAGGDALSSPVAGAPPAEAATPAAPPVPAEIAARTGELTAPDDFAMVMLYYSLTGLQPPIDKWVEDDMSVRTAAPADKAAAREAVRARFASGLQSVKDVGRLRITSNANLSDYDPSYGEYSVRVFAPSSSLIFNRSGERIHVKFDNAQAAQRWSVPQVEAQSIRDRIQYPSAVAVDALLQITGAAPERDGGTIRARVISYELKNNNSGTTIARVTVPQ